MSKKLVGFILLLLILFPSSNAFASYDFTKGCETALLEILNLHIDRATEILNQERKNDPDNYFIDYLENYKDIVELLILEDKGSYEEFLDRYYDRLDRMEDDKSSTPYYRAVRAEMMAQTGLMNVMNSDEISGFLKIVKANKLLKKNFNEFPDFYMNKKLYGVFNVAFDNIPLSVKWATNLMGLVGDTDDGFTYLNTYKNGMDGKTGLYSESLIYMIFAYSIVNDFQGAYEMLKKDYAPYMSTTLGTYLYALMLYRTGRNEESLQLLYSLNVDDMDVQFNPIIQLISREKMNRLDADADTYLLKYLNNSKNENLKKETSYKLSCYYLINNNKEKFIYYRNLVDTYDKAIMREDREADVEVEKSLPINIDLLKAQFLVTGSYFENADSILKNYNPETDKNLSNKTQYYLLKGKILSKTGGYNEAIYMFNKAIDQGKKIPESYAAEAALLAGTMAQENSNYKQANDYYKLCQSIDCDNNIYREVINKNLKIQQKKLKNLYP